MPVRAENIDILEAKRIMHDEEIDEYEVGAFYDDEDDRRFQQSGDDPHHLKTNNRGDKHFEYSTSPVGEMIVAADDSTHDMDDRSDEDLYYEDEYEEDEKEKQSVWDSILSNRTFFALLNEQHVCLRRADNLCAMTEEQFQAALNASESPPIPRPAIIPLLDRAQQHREQQLRRQVTGRLGQHDDPLQLSKQLAEKMRDFSSEAKRIIAEQPDPAKRSQMLRALTKEMEDFEKSEREKLKVKQQQMAKLAENNNSVSDNAITSGLILKAALKPLPGQGVQEKSKQSQVTIQDVPAESEAGNYKTEAAGGGENNSTVLEVLGFRPGADCEQLLCAVCMVIAEVTLTRSAAMADGEVVQQQNLAGVCPHVTGYRANYIDLVSTVCNQLAESKDVGPFLSQLWMGRTGSMPPLLAQRSACFSVRLCEAGVSLPPDNLSKLAQSVNLTPLREQEQDKCEVPPRRYHRDRRCGLCQVFMAELEVRLHLHSQLNEEYMQPIVQDTCRRLGVYGDTTSTALLNTDGSYIKGEDRDEDVHESENQVVLQELREFCAAFTAPGRLMRLSWKALLHKERIRRMERLEKKFPDYMCEDIGSCRRMFGEDELQQQEAALREEAIRSMEAVYY